MKCKICIIMILLLTLFVYCQRNQKAVVDKPTIALVMKTLNNPFFIDMQKGAEQSAQELGVNLIVQAADREIDVEKQMQIIENLIQRNVDAICLVPSGSKEIVPAVVKANRAHIPIINVDSRIDSITIKQAGGHIETFIGSDNIEGGRIAGKYIIEKLGGQGQVAVLEGIPGHETADARLNGFKQAVANAPHIDIKASQTANWERDQGFNVFQNILQSHPNVKALFACNDMMALGAIEAIAAAGKTGDMIVIGFDAVNDAKDAIRKGLMAGSIAQHPFEMGKIAIEKALSILNGEKVEHYIPVKIELITKAKLEQQGDFQ